MFSCRGPIYYLWGSTKSQKKYHRQLWTVLRRNTSIEPSAERFSHAHIEGQAKRVGSVFYRTRRSPGFLSMLLYLLLEPKL